MEINERTALSESHTAASWPPVFVLATESDATTRALRRAALIRQETGARIVLLVPEVGASRSDRSQDAIAERAAEYRDLATKAGVEAAVCVCVCRRIGDIFRQVVDKPSTIVIGTADGWFGAAADRRLAAALARQGHAVVLEDKQSRNSDRNGRLITRLLKAPFIVGLITLGLSVPARAQQGAAPAE